MARSIKRTPPVVGPILGYDEFELNIESVLRDQLPNFFHSVDEAPLTYSNVQTLPVGAKGAYMLLHGGVPVYAGKTDSRHGFRDRLKRHWYTLQHRQRLRIEDMSFKAVRVMVFSNFDVETILIEEMRLRDSAHLTWNDSGFGSNDPGRNREGQEPAEFDELYPIDIDKPLDVIRAGKYNLRDLLVDVKEKLPYLLRYETDETGRRGNKVTYARHTVGHADQRAAEVDIPHDALTMREFLTIVIRALPGWQGTVFPGRVILYRENQDYQFAMEYFR
ncbi:MAG: hypothetical protein M0Z48_10315 [Nitrospiraceae bacterium]|nr:hypothetical protein [Nitrospiraceae bacterium]